ncbi:MAG: filamentation induced by cAMP protein [Geobacteraceae bacterium]|nr:MAG: filamentation induced by cAMP protein [Geobacteraceae bacterium]
MYHYIWERPNWTEFRWQTDKLLLLLGECRLLQGKLLSKVADLGFSLGHQAQAEILAEETLKTAAIEGETLDMKAVRSSVARKLGLPTAGLPVDRHVDGLVSVLLDATQNYDQPFTEERLCGWQAALFPTGYSGMHRIRVGQWRGDEPMRVVSGPVGRETVHFEAPPADRIAAEVRQFFAWWGESRGKVEGVLRAAIAHFRFVTIHPFEDGNGRIARALTDMAMSQDDRQPMRYYSLSSQIMAEREAYYDVLERCQKGDGEITEWLSWFLGCFSRAIRRSEGLLSAVLDKAAFWKMHAHVPLSERQRKVVNRLLDAGRGGFAGGLTTRKYAALADVSRATAFRELAQLLELGIIKQNPGKGRSTSYDLTWPEEAEG